MSQRAVVDGKEHHMVNCPSCGGEVAIPLDAVNCGEFVHAVLKATGQPANPHATRAEVERLLAGDAIWGCGAAFKYAGR